jgi:hypothetical protein
MRILFGKDEALIYLPQFDSEAWSAVVSDFMDSLDNPLISVPQYDKKNFRIRVPYKGDLSNIAFVGLKQFFTKKCSRFLLTMSSFFRVDIVRVFASDFSKKKKSVHYFYSDFHLKDHLSDDQTRLKAFIRYLVSTINPKASDCRLAMSNVNHIKVSVTLGSDLSCLALNRLFLSVLDDSDV